MEDLFYAQFFQTESDVPMADLARLCQKPDEKATQFINRFKRTRTECKIVLPKLKLVKLGHNGFEFRFRKKFDAIEIRDLVELTTRVSRYEALLEKES